MGKFYWHLSKAYLPELNKLKKKMYKTQLSAKVITLYPELFPGPLSASVTGIGLERESLTYRLFTASGWIPLPPEYPMYTADPSICKLCTLEEKGGMFSRRNGSKKRYPDLFEKAEALTAEDGSINTKDFPLQYLLLNTTLLL